MIILSYISIARTSRGNGEWITNADFKEMHASSKMLSYVSISRDVCPILWSKNNFQ